MTVYCAAALAHLAHARFTDDYEAEARLVPIAEAHILALAPDQLAFLDAAVRTVHE